MRCDDITEGMDVSVSYYRPPVHTNGPSVWNALASDIKTGASARAASRRRWEAIDEALCALIDMGWDGDNTSITLELVCCG